LYLSNQVLLVSACPLCDLSRPGLPWSLMFLKMMIFSLTASAILPQRPFLRLALFATDPFFRVQPLDPVRLPQGHARVPPPPSFLTHYSTSRKIRFDTELVLTGKDLPSFFLVHVFSGLRPPSPFPVPPHPRKQQQGTPAAAASLPSPLSPLRTLPPPVPLSPLTPPPDVKSVLSSTFFREEAKVFYPSFPPPFRPKSSTHPLPPPCLPLQFSPFLLPCRFTARLFSTHCEGVVPTSSVRH